MTTDQPRTDGLPQGHPEHLTQSLRLVTLHAVLNMGADGQPEGVTAEMVVHPAFSTVHRAAGCSEEQVAQKAVELVGRVLATEDRLVVPLDLCSCGTVHIADDEPDGGPQG